MNTIQVNILNPKADIILKDMEKQNLIAIQKPSKSTLQSVLNNLRSNAKTAPSLKEITKEVELVRSKRYTKTKSAKNKLNLKPKTWEAQFKKAIADGDSPESDFYS
jgi:hypothetical protein